MLLWFNKDKPDAEGSDKKKETDIDLQWDNSSQAEGPWRPSSQTSTQELATQGTVTIVKNYRTMRQ